MKTSASSQKREAPRPEETVWIEQYLSTTDTSYLGRLYEKYKKSTFLRCLEIVKDREAAQDLTSEVFIRVFDKIRTFKTGVPFAPWLSRITVNLCIDYLRRQSYRRFRLIQEGEDFVAPQEPAAFESGSETPARLLAALKALNPKQRRCFCLFYVHGLSYKEIAELTGYSKDQVRSYIQNGRRNFKIFWEQP